MMQSKKFQRGNSIAAMGGRNMRDSSFSRDILNLTNQDSSQITGSTTISNKHEMHTEKDIKKK